MHYLQYIVPLFLIYLALTAEISIPNLVMGVLVAVAASLLVRPRRRAMTGRQVPVAFLALLQYILILMVDVIKNGLQVARIVLTPKLPIKPGIIAIPSYCSTEMGTALSAHAITVSPGELVVEISEDGVMYTHALDASDSEKKAAEAQEMRVNLLQRIFP
jgi:multicomponent Na+:H+ antiporter subunit E